MKIAYLSFIPFPLPDESPISAIQRTARANGFKNCRRLLSYLRKSTGQTSKGNYLMTNSAISRTFQTCARKYAARIAGNFYQPTYPLMKRSNVIIKGIEILYSNLRHERSALCTQCLKEGHEKFPRDIKLFSSCPFHNCAFLFNCPFCGSKIQWETQLTDVCDCGENLISPTLPGPENNLDHYLLELFKLGSSEQIATIQRIVATLELETYTSDDAVKSGRRALAIAICRKDVEDIINAIHTCLPSSTVAEIDFVLSFFKGDLTETLAATLRQRLTSTTFEQKASVARIALSMDKLRNYIGVSTRAWYKLKYHHALFKGIGRGAKISHEDAVNLKKTVTADQKLEDALHQKTLDPRNKQALSTSAVAYFTDLPEKAINIIALNSNLLGSKTRYAKLITLGSDFLFTGINIYAFNQRYVCSHRLSREWGIPIADINDAILAHHFQYKKSRFIQDTIIIKKSLSLRLFTILKNFRLRSAHQAKRLDVPKITPPYASDYLTSVECAKLLTIPVGEINLLIRKKIIPCHFRGKRGRYLISKEDALDFGTNHLRIAELSKQLNVSSTKASQLLTSVGIMPISGPFVNSGKIHIYKKNSIPTNTLNSLRNHEKTAAQQPKQPRNTSNDSSEFCVNINLICEKFSISKSRFYNSFLAKNVIPYKSFRSGKHITKKDYNKVCLILKNYVPYEKAALILNVQLHYIRYLILKKELILDNSLFHPAKNPGLLSIEQLNELRSKQH